MFSIHHLLILKLLLFFISLHVFQTFKTQIEKTDQYNGALLSPQETKIIFGNIPPIYDAHCKMRTRLQDIVENWREEVSVADVILDNVRTLTTFPLLLRDSGRDAAHWTTVRKIRVRTPRRQ